MITEIEEMDSNVDDLDGAELLNRIKIIKKKYQDVMETNQYLVRLVGGV